MILFSLPPYQRLGQTLARGTRNRVGTFSTHRFPNQELTVTLTTPVKNRSCVIVGSIAPPDEQLLSVLMLVDTLRHHGAKIIHVALPYLAYTRADKVEHGKSFAGPWTGKLLRAAGADTVVSIDIHNPALPTLYPLPLQVLSAASLFANVLTKMDPRAYSLVAPDAGAIARCEELRQLVNPTIPVAHLDKRRRGQHITHSSVRGEVRSHAVVVDDILDTGTTLLSCCARLRQRGVKETTVFVTHGLFTGTRWQKLWSLGVKHIYCTDSVPLRRKVSNKKITTVSVTPLLQEYIGRLKK